LSQSLHADLKTGSLTFDLFGIAFEQHLKKGNETDVQ